MSRDTLSILKRHLKEKKRSVVPNIVQEHLYFDMYEGVARNKQQIDATAGAVVGEATRQGLYLTQLVQILNSNNDYTLYLVNMISVIRKSS